MAKHLAVKAEWLLRLLSTVLLLFALCSALVIACNFPYYLRFVYGCTYSLIGDRDGSFALGVAFELTAPRYIVCGNDLDDFLSC